MQTSFEIINGLLRNKPVDRIGLYDTPWDDTLKKWTVEGGYPKNDQDKPVSPVDFFNFDMAGCGGWFDCLPLPGQEEVLEETDEWILKRNGAGAALKTWKHKSGAPGHVDFLMTNRQVWEKDYRPHLLEVNPERLDIEFTQKELARRREQGCWTFYSHMFIWEIMRSSMGDICMYESLALDPGWVHDFNRVYTDFFKAHYKILIEEAGKPDGIWMYEDLGYNKGLFCSPQTLKDLIFPYYREMVDFFHGYDLPVILHACGGITDALPLIIEAGFDGLNPMEAKAGCDVVDLAQKYGDQIAFIGGFDGLIFESGDREKIGREVRRILNGIKASKARYVFGSDHSISTNVKLADFQYALEVYRENMFYRKKT